MSVFQQTVNVFADTSYPADPQVVIPFEAKSVSIVNEDLDDNTWISFDGVNDHGHLIRGNGITYQQRVDKVWLRRGSGAATSPTNVSVTAES